MGKAAARLSRRLALAGLASCAVAGGSPRARAEGAAEAEAESPPILRLDIDTAPDLGDLDAVLRRGDLRFLAPYSPTLLFEDRGEFRGLMGDSAARLETWLRRRFAPQARNLVVSIRPCSRDRLLPDLLAGLGDVAGGDITITPDRSAEVAFSRPTGVDVEEIVVTPAGRPPMASADELSGQSIAARPGTSTYQSLQALNARLVAAGRPPCRIIDLPAVLEVEDMMEMVGAGLLPAVPAEDWVVAAWKGQIPGIMAHPKALLRAAALTGWAVRPSNPRLLAMLNEAMSSVAATPERLSQMGDEAAREAVQLHAATSPREMEKFRATVALFKRYAPQYGFDELMLLAQGYQESRLDQRVRSSAGAIGLMQLLPATGAEMKVGDIHQPGPNVHAGAKYMRNLLETYLSDAKFDRQNRTLFAFACYNAGPTRIAALRKEAQRAGYDPNVWFDNVERIVARRIGQETVRYVRNIYKYYTGYRLIAESRQAKHTVRGNLQAPPSPAKS